MDMLSMLAAHSWIIIAFTQLVKKLEIIPEKFLPLVSTLVGGITGYFLSGMTIEGLGWGLVAGVTATGTFAAGKELVRENNTLLIEEIPTKSNKKK